MIRRPRRAVAATLVALVAHEALELDTLPADLLLSLGSASGSRAR